MKKYIIFIFVVFSFVSCGPNKQEIIDSVNYYRDKVEDPVILNVITSALEYGIDAESSIDGRTPLSYASEFGYTKVVKALIDSGAEIDKAADGRTALMYAISSGYIEIVNLFIEEGAWIDGQSIDGYTALMAAAEYGKTEIVQALIKADADINLYDYTGKTAIDFALQGGYIDIFYLLTEAGAVAGNLYLDKALIYASVNNQTNLVKNILNREVDVNATDDAGWTATMYAAKNGNLDMLISLINAGAVFRIETAFIIGAEKGQLKIVEFFLELFNNDLIEKYAGTALLYAIINDKVEVCRVLLQENFPVNGRDMNGKTLLQYARECGNSEIEELLLAAGATE